MAHGAQDFYQYRTKSPTYPVSDLAELAARLGSPATYDRRGDVIWASTFAEGLTGWNTLEEGAGSPPTLTGTRFYIGPYAVKVVTTTTNDEYYGVARRFSFPHASALGLEFAFAMGSAGTQSIRLRVDHYDGATRHMYGCLYDSQDKTVQVRTGVTGFETIASDVVLFHNDRLFYPFKLVFDPSSATYTRVLLAANEYTSITATPGSQVSNLEPHLYVEMAVSTQSGTIVTSYLDVLIITENEP